MGKPVGAKSMEDAEEDEAGLVHEDVEEDDADDDEDEDDAEMWSLAGHAFACRGKRRRSGRLQEKPTLSSLSASTSISSAVFSLLKAQQAQPETFPQALCDVGKRAEWRALLHQGHSLLFHGYGSK